MTPSRRKFKFVSFLAVVFLIAAGFLVFIRPQVPEALSGAAQFLGRPLWKASSAIQENLASLPLLCAPTEAARKVEELSEELDRLRLRSLSYNLLSEENVALKELMGRRVGERDPILALVLSRPNQTPYDTLIIDAGSREEISVGDRILASGSLILGYVTEVHQDTSVATLFSSPGERISVFLGGDEVAAVAEGRGGGNFVVELPRDVPVLPGDSVSIPDLDYPFLATVAKIEKRPADAFQTIRFRNPVNISNLRFVEVLRN